MPEAARPGWEPTTSCPSTEPFPANGTRRGVSPTSSGKKPALFPACWLLPAASLQTPARSPSAAATPAKPQVQAELPEPTRITRERGEAHGRGESGISQVPPATGRHSASSSSPHLTSAVTESHATASLPCSRLADNLEVTRSFTGSPAGCLPHGSTPHTARGRAHAHTGNTSCLNP